MVADTELPDRRNMLERQYEVPELFDMLRSSGRFVPQPALYPVHDQTTVGGAQRVEIVNHSSREADLRHAHIIAYASAADIVVRGRSTGIPLHHGGKR